jgi:aminoglycoside phosphotransferase (APT) family kinase protein
MAVEGGSGMASRSPIEAVPEARRELAEAALAEVLGRRPLDNLRPLSGGASGALIYRAEAGGRAWLLRLEPTAGAGFRDPQRAYGAMQAAAAAGVAPALRHADPDKGVAVMDFIVQRPLAEFPGGPAALVEALARMIAQVHAIEPPFGPPRGDYPVLVDFMLTAIRRSGLFKPGLLDPHAEGLARVRAAYRFEGPPVSCHNDPNALNVLFDGERLWLVDWELAFRNDPLIDVGILAENFAREPAAAEHLLAAWLGREPDAAVRARFALARQLSRAFYACALLTGASLAPPPEPDGLAAPTEAEFRQALAEGRLKVGSPELVYALGKMQLASFLTGMQTPEVEAALALGASG